MLVDIGPSSLRLGGDEVTSGTDVHTERRELFVLLGAHEEHDVTATHPRVADRDGLLDDLRVGHHPAEQSHGTWCWC